MDWKTKFIAYGQNMLMNNLSQKEDNIYYACMRALIIVGFV
jgi:hypothetical protein